MGRPPNIDFSWIFLDFGSQVGAKLRSKIDKISIQQGMKKMMKKTPQKTLKNPLKTTSRCEKCPTKTWLSNEREARFYLQMRLYYTDFFYYFRIGEL